MKRLSTRSIWVRFLGMIISIFWFCSLGFCELRLPAVLASHMVLQQGKSIQVWGWAVPGETINVVFAGQSAATRADKTGKWRVELAAQHAGPMVYSMSITGTQSPALHLEDILVGEVWFCSGQSNMEWQMSRTHSPSPSGVPFGIRENPTAMTDWPTGRGWKP